MKKLNVAEVSNIVGGIFVACKDTFEKEGTGATAVCRKVTTCQGKYGEYTDRAPADLASCA
ncbi:DUF4762 family protein [Serratia sp. L9]|uniref:DUF4762 family protein n=1 Tax=Serratia sp. L9 TaxID=3423946 RepID=UPI003D677A50